MESDQLSLAADINAGKGCEPMPLLKPREAAAYLGIGEDTLSAMRKDGDLPYVNIGRGSKRETPRYDPTDLDAWLKNRKTQHQLLPGATRKAGLDPSAGSPLADFRAAKERLLGNRRIT